MSAHICSYNTGFLYLIVCSLSSKMYLWRGVSAPSQKGRRELRCRSTCLRIPRETWENVSTCIGVRWGFSRSSTYQEPKVMAIKAHRTTEANTLSKMMHAVKSIEVLKWNKNQLIFVCIWTICCLCGRSRRGCSVCIGCNRSYMNSIWLYYDIRWMASDAFTGRIVYVLFFARIAVILRCKWRIVMKEKKKRKQHFRPMTHEMHIPFRVRHVSSFR